MTCETILFSHFLLNKWPKVIVLNESQSESEKYG